MCIRDRVGADNRELLSAIRADFHLNSTQPEYPCRLFSRSHRSPPCISRTMCIEICTVPLFLGFLGANCGLYGHSGQSSLVHPAATLIEPPQQYKHFCRIACRSASPSLIMASPRCHFAHAVRPPFSIIAVVRQTGYDPVASGVNPGALSELLPHKIERLKRNAGLRLCAGTHRARKENETRRRL